MEGLNNQLANNVLLNLTNGFLLGLIEYDSKKAKKKKKKRKRLWSSKPSTVDVGEDQWMAPHRAEFVQVKRCGARSGLPLGP